MDEIAFGDEEAYKKIILDMFVCRVILREAHASRVHLSQDKSNVMWTYDVLLDIVKNAHRTAIEEEFDNVWTLTLRSSMLLSCVHALFRNNVKVPAGASFVAFAAVALSTGNWWAAVPAAALTYIISIVILTIHVVTRYHYTTGEDITKALRNTIF